MANELMKATGTALALVPVVYTAKVVEDISKSKKKRKKSDDLKISKMI